MRPFVARMVHVNIEGYRGQNERRAVMRTGAPEDFYSQVNGPVSEGIGSG